MTCDTIFKCVCALSVMAKAPLAGEVKTRLVPPLTEQEAAELSVCFLRDTAANIVSVSETEAASGLIIYTPISSESAFDGILPEGFKLLPIEMLPPWYDVDDAETLNRLCEDLFFSESLNRSYPAPHTREFLESIITTEGPQRICPTLSTRMSI